MISRFYIFWVRLVVCICVFVGGTVAAFAACGFENKQAITYEFPSYSFYKIIGTAIEECDNVASAYTSDSDAIGLANQASSKKVANLLGVSVSSLSTLNERKLLRPLDDLVEKYGDNLHPRQLIKRNGQIVAIAVSANAQVLVYHEGILAQATIDPPKTFSKLMDSAQQLTKSAVITKPFSIAFKDGWSVSNEFVNLLLSDGGALLDAANKPDFNNAKGEAALNQMIALLGYIPKDYEKADALVVQNHLARGEVAMGSLWASSAVQLENPAISRVAGRIKIIPLPSLNIGGKPASSFWWDGIAISSTSSQAEAEAAFKVAMEGLDQEMMINNRDAAIWLMKEYIPNSLTQAVIDSIDAGIPEHPASVAMDMLYKVLGEEIPKFLKGEKGATQTLIDASTAYSAAARERGLIN